MDFKKTFISLTQWTIPHGYEETIVHLLPKGLTKDGGGNYFITIGESETLFTCHLDTVSERAKVHHIIEDNIIKTDGTTVLGGDNKAGVCILMYLIEQQVPGTYYFFIGEECGTIGSRWALANNPEYFKKFKRAVAYDRRNQGSIITFQRGRRCASDAFANALAVEFEKNGMAYHIDPGGVYTDTAVFMNVIPECTNLSAGVVGEHTNSEHIDIDYCKAVALASAKINWEGLPAIREAKEEVYTTYNNYGHNDYYSRNRNYNRNGNFSLYRNKNKNSRDPEEEDDEEEDFNVNFVNRSGNIVERHFHIDEEEYNCPNCEGDGQLSCESCAGMGDIECDDCDGCGRIYSKIPCKRCNGEGIIDLICGDASSQQVCPSCEGESYESEKCEKCNGSGSLGECVVCNGTGDIDCPVCMGSGVCMDIEEDEEEAEYNSERSFFDEDPDDYDWRWNTGEGNWGPSRTNEVYSNNLMIVKQPNNLFAIFNDATSYFIKFNLLDEEVQDYLSDEQNMSTIMTQFIIQGAVNDRLAKAHSEFHKFEDGLGRWRYCLNQLEGKVGGDSFVSEAIEEDGKFILKGSDKFSTKKTRRSGQKKSDNMVSKFNKIAPMEQRNFINKLNDSEIDEFVMNLRMMKPNDRKKILNRLVSFVKKNDLSTGKPMYFIFKAFDTDINDINELIS